MQALPAGSSNFRISRNFRYWFGPPSKVSAGSIRQFPPAGAAPTGQPKRSPMRLISLTNPTRRKTAAGFRPFRYFRRSVSMPGKRANDGTCCESPAGWKGGDMQSPEVKVKYYLVLLE
jgi:hypothetical protein